MSFEPQAVCLASMYSFHVWAASKAFSQLPSRSASFQVVQPASKPFSQLPSRSVSFQVVQPASKSFSQLPSRSVSLCDRFALYNWKRANQFKKNGLSVYKPVAHLQTGQVSNWFATLLKDEDHYLMWEKPSRGWPYPCTGGSLSSQN